MSTKSQTKQKQTKQRTTSTRSRSSQDSQTAQQPTAAPAVVQLGPGMKLVQARLGALQPNEWNPNVMSPEKQNALNRTMQRFGYRQFIVAREVSGEQLEIVDGEHRWRELMETHGPEHTAWVIVQELSDADARLSTLGLNNPRGDDDPIALAKLVIDLRDRFGVPFEEIEDAAGYNRQHLDELEKLVMPMDAGEMPPSAVESPVAEVHIALFHGQNVVWEAAMEKALRVVDMKDDSILLAGAQVATFDKAMRKASKLGDTRSRARALELICAAFLAEPEESYTT